MSTTQNSSLKEKLHPLIRNLADCIQNTWQSELTLAPYSIPEDLGYIENTLDGEKLSIENHCYQTPQFRKLHLELAQVGGGLDILHCVMFPHVSYPLPMFGTDIVVGRGRVSAAIVDLSPIPAGLPLPMAYAEALAALPNPSFAEPRELPSWGDIFSPFCTFIHPVNEQEEAEFLQRVQHFLTLHCQIAQVTTPADSEEELHRLLTGQTYYCARQRQNDKTRRVLEKAFGQDWTTRYMTTMLFDEVDQKTFANISS